MDQPRLEQIGRSNFELAVIDYSEDGSASGEFRREQIEALRQGGCRRRVLAYMSIGEAENYRFYWQRAWRARTPDWIAGKNPRWPGTYLVRYWAPAWQSLMYEYLDRIIAQGFDGVYFDRVDAYADGHARGRRQDMVNFVLALGRYARAQSPLGEDFGVLVQNAEEIGADESYVAQLTGIGREEVYVRATNRPTSRAERTTAEDALHRFRKSSLGHLVLTVDYATRADLIGEAYTRARARGFIPYVTDVALNRIRINLAYLPRCSPVPSPSSH